MPAGEARPVVAGVDGSECSLHAVRWAAAEAVRRCRPLRLVAAHAWPSGGLVGEPHLGFDVQAVLRDMVLDHLAAAAGVAAAIAPDLDIDQVEVTGLPVPVLQAEST